MTGTESAAVGLLALAVTVALGWLQLLRHHRRLTRLEERHR